MARPEVWQEVGDAASFLDSVAAPGFERVWHSSSIGRGDAGRVGGKQCACWSRVWGCERWLCLLVSGVGCGCVMPYIVKYTRPLYCKALNSVWVEVRRPVMLFLRSFTTVPPTGRCFSTHQKSKRNRASSREPA